MVLETFWLIFVHIFKGKKEKDIVYLCLKLPAISDHTKQPSFAAESWTIPSTCIIQTEVHHCTERNKFKILLRLRNAPSRLDSSAGNSKSDWQKYQENCGSTGLGGKCGWTWIGEIVSTWRIYFALEMPIWVPFSGRRLQKFKDNIPAVSANQTLAIRHRICRSLSIFDESNVDPAVQDGVLRCLTWASLSKIFTCLLTRRVTKTQRTLQSINQLPKISENFAKISKHFRRFSKSFNLKGFFHGSAHARVPRNLICVPARNKANFWGFTRRIVEGGFYL